jgi:hypothetical protein
MAERGALILNEVLPAELRVALDQDAEAQDVTLNDAAGAILAEHFGLAWEYSGKGYQPRAQQFKLRVPEALHLKIRIEAALNPQTVVRGIAVSVLADHYGLAAISPTRRPRSVPS